MVENDKFILKFIKDPEEPKQLSKRKTKLKDLNYQISTMYKAIVIKIVEVNFDI